MRTMKHLVLAISLAASSALAQPAPALLPALNVDAARSSVSGISAGGYMAVQLHVAHSARFGAGAGVIAGGPFYCAEGSVLSALTRCFGKTSIPVESLIETTRKWAADKAIDPLPGLANSKVYVFSGAKDSVIPPATSEALVKYYAAFLPEKNIVFKRDVPAEHGFVTDEGPAACDNKAAPFLNNCGFDLAGAILAHIHGPLVARSAGAPQGSLIAFDQSAFEAGHGMGAIGYVYVPKACAGGESCRVHVVLHGCKQNATDVGDAFAKGAGFNRWADTNRLVILYPQTGKGATNGCWDWWGYDDANYAKQSAPQMRAIMAMLDRLSSGPKK
ncbi:MAG TPA: PHB depolymerase family esterase [Usitatibacteraceae bacterium]|nr:PHB depolymerase family esterase [Usitatibacteraceae bacterium]